MPLEQPMVKGTNRKVTLLINELYRKNHIDEMTKKCLCQTPNPPRIPIFYTLTKIHKPTPVGRPIISGCEGPTEKLSSFVDKLLQPIAFGVSIWNSIPLYAKTLNISNFRKKIKSLLFNVLGNEDNYLNVNYLIEYFVKLT